MAERLSSRERGSAYQALPGFQGRAVLADRQYLDPAKRCPEISAQQIKSFENRDYSVIEEASLTERKAVWQGMVDHGVVSAEHESQYVYWRQSLVETMAAGKQMTAQLKPVFDAIGIDADDFRAEHSDIIYRRYFGRPTEDPYGPVKAFIADSLAVCRRADGKVDSSAINRMLPQLQWFASVFGQLSAERVAQMVDAETKIINDKEAYVGEINANINNLHDADIRLLAPLAGAAEAEGQPPDVERPEQEAEPPPNGSGGELPIMRKEQEIKQAVRENDEVFIISPTGSGKSSLVPKFIDEIKEPGQKTAVTLPRRILAESAADSIAYQMDVEVGEEVGFQHGEGRKISDLTDTFAITEGSLIRQIGRDPLLKKYDYVMVDEWHEQHTDTVVLVALLRRAQELRRQAIESGQTDIKPLKIIYSSATVNKDEVREKLPRAKIIEAEGRLHPINDVMLDEVMPGIRKDRRIAVKEMPNIAAQLAAEKIRPGRKMLIFMPGESTIKQTVDQLKSLNLPDYVEIKPLYGSMSSEEQADAKRDEPGKTKIIIASPLAESGLDFTDCDVISSGYVNRPRIDEETGLYFLETVEHSGFGLNQQRGRAGRRSPGTFYFLGTREQYEGRRNSHLPEIGQADFTGELLLLKSMGLTYQDIEPYMTDKVPDWIMRRANRRLEVLGAQSADGRLSRTGKRMAGIHTDYHAARMMIEAFENSCFESATGLAAMIQMQQKIYLKPGPGRSADAIAARRKQFQEGTNSDFFTLFNIWRQYRQMPEGDRQAWANRNFLNYAALVEASEVYDDLIENSRKSAWGRDEPAKLIDTVQATPDLVMRMAFAGYRDNIMKKTSHAGRIRYEFAEKGIYPAADNLLPDESSAVDETADNSEAKTTHDYLVCATNYPRQRKNMRQSIYTVVSQAVPADWL